MKKDKIMDFQFMKEWCILILTHLSDQYKQKDLFKYKIEKVQEYFLNKEERKMEILYREIYSMAITSSEIVKEELDRKLRERFNKVLIDVPPVEEKTKRLTEYKQKELEFMKDWNVFIYNYLYNDFLNKADDVLKKKYGVFFQTQLNAIIKAFQRNDYRGMKMMYRDTNEMAMDMPNEQLLELNKMLQERFGHSLQDEEKKVIHTIDKIVKRGKIINDEEYSIVETTVAELCQTQPDSIKIDILNKLLVAYIQ